MNRTLDRLALALCVTALVACEGPVGPQGPRGERGLQGPPGADLDASPVADTGPGDGAGDGALPPYDGAYDAGVMTDPRGVCQSCHPGLDVTALNLIGIHDANSRRYLPNCLHCHADILQRPTRYPEIHRRMVPYTGTFRGSVRNEDCTFCHRSVEFGGNRSAANLRRQVAASACAGCHANGRWDYYLP